MKMAVAENCGRSLVSAVEEKYKMDDSALDIHIFGLPKNSPDGPGEIIVPKFLCIQEAKVTHAGDTAQLAQLCKNVCEVDLEENLINDWNEVFTILTHVPHCSLLNLRANPLACYEPKEPENIPVFKNIVELVLNHTNISWSSLCFVLQAFPSLQRLHLSMNYYGTVGMSSECTFPSVTSLNFRENNISDWKEVTKLGQAFPNLENLVLLNNPLETFPNAEEMTVMFPKLKTINVSETNIKEWEELEKLKYFPNLCELKVTDIPLLQSYKEDLRRQLLLGYLPNITRLNGGRVTDGAKEDAERAFIRYYMEKSTDEQPPRLTELEAKHGKLEPLVEVDLSVKDDVTVLVHFNNEARLVQLNIHQTEAELKNKLAKDFNIPLLKGRLSLQRHGWPVARVLTEPNRTLLNHRIDDGDEIFVQEKFAPVLWQPCAFKNTND